MFVSVDMIKTILSEKFPNVTYWADEYNYCQGESEFKGFKGYGKKTAKYCCDCGNQLPINDNSCWDCE